MIKKQQKSKQRKIKLQKKTEFVFLFHLMGIDFAVKKLRTERVRTELISLR